MRYNLPALNCFSQTNYTPTADSFIEPAAVIFDYFGGILVRQPLFYCPARGSFPASGVTYTVRYVSYTTKPGREPAGFFTFFTGV